MRAAADAARYAADVCAANSGDSGRHVTVFLLFQRQTTMINARTQLARAEADLSIAISQYGAATGTTLKIRNVNLQP